MRLFRVLRRAHRLPPPALGSSNATPAEEQPASAYEPELVPPLALMRREGIDVLEEWFRWAEEWSMLLRIYGRLARDAAVLEIGCGLGRVAFPLRYVLSDRGRYEGFEIDREKVEFLKTHFEPSHPNFRFTLADVHNTYYNPDGQIRGEHYRFPYEGESFDVVFAASVFTHMLPPIAGRYFAEAGRVLREGGRCVFSFFLLDNYKRERSRPLGFARPDFDFDHTWGDWGARFAIANPANPEEMTAYRIDLVRILAAEAGLRLAQDPVPGLWSGRWDAPVAAQDVVVLER